MHLRLLNQLVALTCLWVENLRREVRGRRPRGKVFIAVGDQRCEGMNVMGVLYHWHLIGLKNKMRT